MKKRITKRTASKPKATRTTAKQKPDSSKTARKKKAAKKTTSKTKKQKTAASKTTIKKPKKETTKKKQTAAKTNSTATEISTKKAAKTKIAADTLTKIEGISSKVQKLLFANGVTTYAKLAKTKPKRLEQLLDKAGADFHMMDPSTWPEQATMASKGQWIQLRVWQDKLHDGFGKPKIAITEAPRQELTKIEGIDNQIQQLLYDAGITTFDQLADTDTKTLEEILARGGTSYRIVTSDTWADQARLAAEGKWTQLRAFQDQLEGGVDRHKESDDLSIIEGIGDEIEKLLHASSISTYSDLARADVEALRVILAAAGPEYVSDDPETWPRQATLASRAQWTELKRLQDRLSGGRKRA